MTAPLRSLTMVVGLLLAPGASAYPWLIKHNYASCAACHVDPSGGGVLTAYGRVQTEQLVEARWSPPRDEPSKTTGPFLGLVPLPDWAALDFSFRGGALYTRTRNPALSQPPPAVVRPIQMATDLRAGVVTSWLRASASVGFALRRAEAASLTSTSEGGANNVVSREHWVGAVLFDEAVVVRAGRMNLPFGVRTVEHGLWVREATRTDINDQQQHGLAVSYQGEGLRGEVMAIAGNFQLRPDYYRERGYAAFVEWAPLPNVAVGASSLLTAARLDVNLVDAHPVRQAHGLFARAGLGEQLTLAAEVDALLRSADDLALTPGYAAWLQADWEPWRGVHGILSLEASETGEAAPGARLGAWAGVAWFAVRAVELRVDGIVRRLPVSGDGEPVTTFTVMGQLHLAL